MAVKTYRLGAGADGNFAALFEADQAAANRADGWTVAKLAAGNSSEFDVGVKQASGTFTSNTTTPKPASFLTGTNANALKTPTPLTGVFANASWSFNFAVRATVASAQAGRIRLRVFKSANADGSGATELTSATVLGTPGTLSTTADVATAPIWNPGTTITLNNEYLFFVIAWEITTASGSNSGDVLLRTGSAVGSRIVTPDFTDLSPTPISGTDSGSATESASVISSTLVTATESGFGSDKFTVLGPGWADDFSTDKLLQYSTPRFPGTFQVAGGELVPLNGQNKAIWPTGYFWGDVELVKKFKSHAANGSWPGLFARRVADLPMAIANGDFSNALAGWGPYRAAISLDSSVYRYASPSCKAVLNQSDASGGPWQQFPLAASRSHGYSVDVLAPAGVQFGIDMNFYSGSIGSGAFISEDYNGDFTGTGSWQNITKNVTPPAGTTWADWGVYLKAGTPAGTVLNIDNAYLADNAADPTELLAEVGDMGGGVQGLAIYKLPGWTALASAPYPAFALDTYYWLRFRVVGNDLTAEMWDVPPTPGGVPLVSCGYTLTSAEATTYAGPAPAGIDTFPDLADRYDDLSIRFPPTYVTGSDGNGPTTETAAVTAIQISDSDSNQPFADYKSLILVDGPLLYYRLGEPGGTAAKNEVGGNNGTYVGAPVLGQSGAVLGDTAMRFDGVNDQVTIPAGFSLPAGSNLTVEFWLFLTITDVTAGSRGVFTLGNRPDPDICAALVHQDGNLYWYYGNGTDGFALTSYVPQGYVDKWTLVQLTFDGEQNTRELYLDGVYRAGTLGPAAPVNPLNGGSIGNSGTATGLGTNWQKGLIDEFAVYDYVLRPEQLLAHYNAGLATSIEQANVLQRMSLSGSDSTGALTETFRKRMFMPEGGVVAEAADGRVFVAAADANGPTTEDSSSSVGVLPVSGADANGAVIEVVAQVATPAAADASGTTGEVVTSTSALASADASAADTEVISQAARTTIDANGATTESGTSSVSVLPVSASDTSGAVTESASVTRQIPSGVADIALTMTDTVARKATHLFADTGLTVADVLARKAQRGLLDTGLVASDSTSVARLYVRATPDSGLVVVDSLVRTQSYARTLVDTGLALTEAYQRALLRSAADTGLVVADAVTRAAAVWTRALIDTALVPSDALTRLGSVNSRSVTDTGVTVADSLKRTAMLRVLVDVGLVPADSLATARQFGRATTDTALVLGDSLLRLGTGSRAVSDIALTVADLLTRRAARTLSEPGLMISDTLVRSSPRALTDIGLVQTDALALRALRALVDLGLVSSDTVARRALHNLTDTALVPGDALSRLSGKAVTLTDSGVTLSDALLRKLVPTLADSGLVLTSTLTRSLARRSADVALTPGDSLARVSATARAPSDVALVLSDLLVARTPVRTLGDSGLVVSDALARRLAFVLSDRALTQADALTRAGAAVRALSDSGLVPADALRVPFVSRHASDTALAFSDEVLTSLGGLAVLIDTAVVMSDVLVRERMVSRALADEALVLVEEILVGVVPLLVGTLAVEIEPLAATAEIDLRDEALLDTQSLETEIEALLGEGEVDPRAVTVTSG